MRRERIELIKFRAIRVAGRGCARGGGSVCGAGDPAHLEFDIKLRARPEVRQRGIGRFELAVRTVDRRAARHDRPAAPVVPDRNVSVVRQQRLTAGAQDAAEVRRVLEG